MYSCMVLGNAQGLLKMIVAATMMMMFVLESVLVISIQTTVSCVSAILSTKSQPVPVSYYV